MVRGYLGAASDGSKEAEERIGRLTGVLVSPCWPVAHRPPLQLLCAEAAAGRGMQTGLFLTRPLQGQIRATLTASGLLHSIVVKVALWATGNAQLLRSHAAIRVEVCALHVARGPFHGSAARDANPEGRHGLLHNGAGCQLLCSAIRHLVLLGLGIGEDWAEGAAFNCHSATHCPPRCARPLRHPICIKPSASNGSLLQRLNPEIFSAWLQPVVIISNISSLASVVAFGMSTQFAPAVVARLCGGTFNFTFG